jgi:hypothetical protein
MNPSAYRLKNPTGWLAADDGFRRALQLLSDSGFKLFAHLSLQACRISGCVHTTPDDLARALNQSSDTIEIIIDELRQKRVCSVRPAKKQPCSLMVFSICDEYWPYKRELHMKWNWESMSQPFAKAFSRLNARRANLAAATFEKPWNLKKMAFRWKRFKTP